MQKMLSYVRRAVDQYHMIEEGDVIAVGVSGGKDSLVLLKGLQDLKRFIGIDYEVVAITLKTGDLLFTGTPAGIGEVKEGDKIEAYIGDRKLLDLKIK